MNEKKLYLGIDMGTSSLKMLLVDEDNRVIEETSFEYEISHEKEGWSEIDPDLWRDAMLHCMEDLLQNGRGALLRGIGITGQMHTLVTLNREGRPLRPAIMWNDTRTAGLISELKQQVVSFDEGEDIAAILSTGSPAANLYWISRNEPELFAGCSHFLIGPDYLAYALTGVVGTDFCEASTSALFCLNKKCWSRQMMDLIGAPESIFPAVRGSGEIVGPVAGEIRERFGLSENVFVIAGTGDNPASALSTGCLSEGYPVLSLGTSGVLMFPAEDPSKVTKGKKILFSEDGKHFSWLVQGVVQSNGASVNWWARDILKECDLNAFEEGDAVDSEELLFYPHIDGEKTLYADPQLRGAFLGLTSTTSALEMYNSVLEGLSFAFKELAGKMGLDFERIDCLRAVGGGSKSDLWLQFLADILEVPVARLQGVVGPGYGAALLAIRADRSDRGSGPFRLNLKKEKVFFPAAEKRDHYRSKYRKYLRIHDALKYIADGSCLKEA